LENVKISDMKPSIPFLDLLVLLLALVPELDTGKLLLYSAVGMGGNVRERVESMGVLVSDDEGCLRLAVEVVDVALLESKLRRSLYS
jgi:hypothetical protein